MVKKAFLALVFLTVSTVAYSAPVPFDPITISCPGGGTLVLSGTIDQAGFPKIAFSFNLAVTNCQDGDDTITGNASSNGSLHSVTSALNTSFSYNLNLAGSDISGTQNCNGTLNGTYNFNTETFQGTENRTCASTGTLHVSSSDLLFEFLFGLED